MAKPLRSPRADDRETNGAAVGSAGEGREHVVLVHGLLRTPRSWITVRRHLEREDFSTGVFGYPSLRGGLEPHERALAAELRRLARLLGDLFPVLRDLSDADGSAARQLAFPPMEAGVIAARFDHVVAESSTHCPGEADHLLVGASHGWLMYRPSVQRAIVAFLRTGQFPRPPPTPQKSRRREERSSR